ncbi:SusD/RagB family nutrient-binding outer membrane lipoprotein [Chitinophaga pollutisoli]|uniref:SusD/RagB family nutrient-binding outer membrane lipoprotein n=1 Tax=Chitinophaga pollutisoli TaxID=3133966 RepID=A0ABZ2YKA7_9BACT
MKLNKIWMAAVVAGTVGATACKKEGFISYNTNPGTIYNLKPEEQFANAVVATFEADFEYYYDYYRIMMPWMQYHTSQNGNGKTFMAEVGNFNQRRGYFYGRVGNVLTDVQKIIEAMPAGEKDKYQHQNAIATILKVYYAVYTTDINGSMPYTQAFQARYGGTMTPVYDNQQNLYNTFEAELKSAIATLKSASGQASYGNADMFYKGEAANWVKAANALRVRIAMRLLKRDATKAKTIATEALANAADNFAGNADNLDFVTTGEHTGSQNNWDPTAAIFRAPKSLLDFLYTTNDPRLRMFFQKNSYTQENFDLAKAQEKLPPTAVFNPRQYVGSFASPDAAANPVNAKYYTTRTIRKNGADLVLDTLSRVQYRLFCPYSNGGTGRVTFPLLTYAELCFYRAELAARSIVGAPGEAEGWYEKGVKASMAYYSQMAKDAAIVEYSEATDAEINAAYDAPKVKWNAATGLEQIAVQSYINFFKQANEGWSVYKRTGFPNPTSTIFPWERVMADGVEQIMPRRAIFNIPVSTDRNYTNAKAAFDDMAKDADFGQGPTDIYGRVWWDKK